MGRWIRQEIAVVSATDFQRGLNISRDTLGVGNSSINVDRDCGLDIRAAISYTIGASKILGSNIELLLENGHRREAIIT